LTRSCANCGTSSRWPNLTSPRRRRTAHRQQSLSQQVTVLEASRRALLDRDTAVPADRIAAVPSEPARSSTGPTKPWRPRPAPRRDGRLNLAFLSSTANYMLPRRAGFRERFPDVELTTDT